MPETIVDAQARVIWRRIGRGLWLARRDDRHLGAIEQRSRRRFVAFDADSTVLGAYCSLGDAQGAVLHPVPGRLPDRASWEPLLLVGICTAAAMTMLAPFGLLIG